MDGPAPRVGEWVVVHSGYVLERVNAADAEAIAQDLRRALAALDEERE
jgi:hydrogenase maturation factor